MKPRHRLLLFCLLLAAHVTGCRSARPAADERAAPAVVSRPAILDNSPPTAAPLPKPGFFPSTPEGSARRQARKDVKAATPRAPFFIGKGAVNAPLAKEVVNAYKPKAPVTKADSGAVVNNAAENAQLQAAVGDGNELEATKKDTQVAPLGIAGILKRVALVAALGAGLYFFWPVLWPLLLGLFRRRNA